MSVSSEEIFASVEGIDCVNVTLGVEHELGVVVLSVGKIDHIAKFIAGAVSQALGKLEEASGIAVGAAVHAGRVATQVLDSCSSHSLQVLILEVCLAFAETFDGRDHVFTSFSGEIFSVLNKTSNVLLNLLAGLLELLLCLVIHLLANLEFATALFETSGIETVLPVSVHLVKLLGSPALSHCALSAADASLGLVVESLTNVVNERLNKLSPVHGDLANSVLVGVLKSLF